MGSDVRGNDQDDQIAGRVAAWMRFVTATPFTALLSLVRVCSRARFRLSRFGVSGSLRIKVHCNREAG